MLTSVEPERGEPGFHRGGSVRSVLHSLVVSGSFPSATTQRDCGFVFCGICPTVWGELAHLRGFPIARPKPHHPAWRGQERWICVPGDWAGPGCLPLAFSSLPPPSSTMVPF